MLEYSAHNIVSKIKNSNNYFIVNPLSESAGIMSADEYEQFGILIEKQDFSSQFASECVKNGYITDSGSEKTLFNQKYLDFIDSRDTDEIQLFFVPNYSCNFACSYCYQEQYIHHSEICSNEVIDAFFNYIDAEFKDRKKYITLFGGEPLLSSSTQKDMVKYFLEKSVERNLDVCIVTNGYHLTEYIDLLKNARIREIQLTLDGTADVHNSRRYLKNKKPTFFKIVEGIDVCLQHKIPVNLRMVIDRENINNLPELASFAIDKGWTQHPLFKTQLGRNYELHYCQSSKEKLFDRLNLYEHLYQLILQFPQISEFYQPAFSISKFLFEYKELPQPLFDSCPATKTEWAFDYTGKIYSCTATVGKPGEELGTFFPIFKKYENAIADWENRDVLAIPECKSCEIQLACGGGCGSVAKNKTGKICSPDCRPVKELMELGFSYYFEKSNFIKK